MKPSHSHSLSLGLAALFLGNCLQAAGEQPPYLDTACPIVARVSDLVSRMTLEEKASMMANSTPGVPRLGIPKYNWWSEALHGVARTGHATVFPQAIGLAAMWDQPFHREIAHVIGVEARAKFNSYAGTDQAGTIYHGLTFWSPNINIFRDPRWGRGQETYGEDPFLTARLGVAFVQGLQGGDHDHLLAAACAKHFAVHSGPESQRHIFDANPPEADLYETYLPAFEALVREGRVEAVMTAYNSLYGTPCSINPTLYLQLAKWGFDGHVTSDCGSVADLSRSYKRAKDDAEAESLTVKAGMNVRCGDEPTQVVEAVRRGLISEAEVNYRVSALLRTMFRLGFFDPRDRVAYNSIAPSENDSPAHGALALRAARESMVLLKNSGVLPLKTESLRRVVVIGPNATSVPALVGNYNGEPSAPVTVLDGLRAALEPAGVKVDYAHGCDYSTRPTAIRPIPNSGFHGEFFNNPDLSGEPAAQQWWYPLNFDAGTTASNHWQLPAELSARRISARWSGELPTTLAGDYHLRVTGRGGFRLSLNGETVLDAWKIPAGQETADRVVEVVKSLPDNSSIPVKLEYNQGDGPVKVVLEWSTPDGAAAESEALAMARSADVIVFVGGITAQLEGEEMQVEYEGFSGGDRTAIELPAFQRQLLEKLHGTGKPVVFVNLSGSAVAMPWENEHLEAILQAWYPGQAGGTAVADVLLGRYNPAGRLPLTFYGATSDLPDFGDYRMQNRTYRYFHGKALYPFGHGLSYTRFEYSNLRVKPGQDSSLEARVDVTNAGSLDGDEVVQLYTLPPAGTHPREIKALCGFSRVHLAKGETKTVTISVPASALRRWDAGKKDYMIASGEWKFMAGASSADIRQAATAPLP